MNLCLIMIVRNESKNMKRILESIKDIISCGSIIDTGSSDNTKDIIIKWFKDNNKILNLEHIPFVNFGFNRTLSFMRAKIAFPKIEYFITSDADFVWKIDLEKFKNEKLIGDKILIKQKNEYISYYNFRLLKASCNFFCLGSTHEIWYCENSTCQTIDSIEICDLEDGGAKEDKYIRDEILLRSSLESEDNLYLKTRYKFYLAQTLQAQRRYLESNIWFIERIKDGGWYEELFFCNFQIGRNYMMLIDSIKQDIKNPKKDYECILKYYKLSIDYFLKAHDISKHRSESLLELAILYIRFAKLNKAIEIIEIAKKIPFPKDDILFVNDKCYNGMFDELLLKIKTINNL